MKARKPTAINPITASTREANYKAAELAAQELIDLDEKGIDKAVVNKAK